MFRPTCGFGLPPSSGQTLYRALKTSLGAFFRNLPKSLQAFCILVAQELRMKNGAAIATPFPMSQMFETAMRLPPSSYRFGSAQHIQLLAVHGVESPSSCSIEEQELGGKRL